MGLLEQIDMELQKDLIDFVKSQEKKPWPHTLGESLLEEILKDIIKGDARISGCLTDHGKKRMYLEVSFYENDGEKKEDNGQENQSQVIPDQD